MQDSTLALVMAGATLVNIAYSLYWTKVNRQIAQSVDMTKMVKSETFETFKKEVSDKFHQIELERERLTNRVKASEDTLNFAKNTLGNPDKVKTDLEKINQAVGLETTGLRTKNPNRR